jgi:hypothetical protein
MSMNHIILAWKFELQLLLSGQTKLEAQSVAMVADRNLDTERGYEKQSTGHLPTYSIEKDSNQISRCEGTKIWRD